MAVNIRALLEKKEEKRSESKRLVLKDINRDLTVALLGISVYGKEARDEDILTIIINGGKATLVDKRYENMVERYEARLKSKELKRAKDGSVTDKSGFLVLVPKTRTK